MSIARWSPFRELSRMQAEMNRLFNEFFSTRPERGEIATLEWSPSVDIYETKDDIVVKAELPGMKIEDIHISVRDNTLTLRGEKKQEKDVKEENYYRIERNYGYFQRIFTLPSSVQIDKIKAKYRDGVLEIFLPKSEEAKPKEIKVEVGLKDESDK